jgi:Zn finger protein HypA/HybF involved in hydrogenase expression
MHELALSGRVDPCPCGSLDIDVVGGKELRIRTVEVQ